jgi:hypothetical protein
MALRIGGTRNGRHPHGPRLDLQLDLQLGVVG